MENFYPIDLENIQDKILAIKHNLQLCQNSERSSEMRAKALENIESYVDVISRDIDYLMDTRLFNGKRALGLDEKTAE